MIPKNLIGKFRLRPQIEFTLGCELILISSWLIFKAKAGLIFFSVTVCQHANIIPVHAKSRWTNDHLRIFKIIGVISETIIFVKARVIFFLIEPFCHPKLTVTSFLQISAQTHYSRWAWILDSILPIQIKWSSRAAVWFFMRSCCRTPCRVVS